MPVRKVCCSVNSFANTFLKSRLSLSVTMIFLKREVLRASLILHCLSIPFFGYHFAVQPPWSDLWFMTAKSLWTKFLSPISGTREFQSIWNVMLYKWCINFLPTKGTPSWEFSVPKFERIHLTAILTVSYQEICHWHRANDRHWHWANDQIGAVPAGTE